MFIEKAYKGLHKSWMYLVGGVLSFFVSQLGGVFLLIFVGRKLMERGGNIASIGNTEVLMNTLSANFTLFLMLFGFFLGLLSLFLVVRYVHRQKIKDLTTTRSKVDFRRIGFGFLLVSVPSTILIGIGYYLNPEEYLLQFDLYPFLTLLLIAIIFIPIQTSFEEYLFRGYLLQGIGVHTKSRAAALLLTSVVFGMLHYFNPEVEKMGNFIMVYYIGTGLFLGIITLMDEGLELALGYHAGNNLMAALLITSDWSVFQTNAVLKDISEPSVIYEVLIFVGIFMPAYYFILAKKYKWTDFRKKIFGKIENPAISLEKNL